MTVYDGQESGSLELLTGEQSELLFTEQDRQNAYRAIGATAENATINTEEVRQRLAALAVANSHQAQHLLDRMGSVGQ